MEDVMLLEFRVKNFQCLRDEQVFSMVASTDKTLLKANTIQTGLKAAPYVLRSGIIYGANASGKSTLIKAFTTFISIIKSSAQWEPNASISVIPFFFSMENLTAPTEFEITVLIGSVRYQYGYACTDERITEEYLRVYTNARPQTLFQRKHDPETEEDQYIWGAALKGQKESWRRQTRPNSLFLSTAITFNSQQLLPLWEEFTRISILSSERIEYYFTKNIALLAKNDLLKRRICEMLTAADIKIVDIKIYENKPKILDKEKEYTVLFAHETENGVIPLTRELESHGTVTLFTYLLPILISLELGCVLCIDELGANLHPLLIRHILSLFQSPKSNPKGAQLIFTSHDISLLQEVGNLFRRDQIWLVEKDTKQASDIYSLAEFKQGKGEDLSLNYLQGLYGGIPLLNEEEVSL